MMVEKGLVIREPWIDLLISGQKTWEMRSQSTSYRGWIALIRKGSGQVSAIARLDSVGAPQSPAQMIETFAHHRIPARMIESGEVAKWNTPWKLTDLRVLPRPVPYIHPNGAITLFNLDADAQRAIAAMLDGTYVPPPQPKAVPVAPSPSIAPKTSAVPKPRPVSPASNNDAPPTSGPFGPNTLLGEVEITQGNLTNNHFYLRSFLQRFPLGLIGGRDLPNPVMAQVAAEGMRPTSTDICPRHKFFRDRSWTRQFFANTDAVPGDVVQVREIAPYRYHISLKKKARP